MFDELKHSVVVDATDKYTLYYNVEQQIIYISNGLELYGSHIDKLGDDLFTNPNKEGDNKDD